MSTPESRSTQELLDALAKDPIGAELRDPEGYRRRVCRELAEHDDPLLREIGSQLRDGVIRPHQLISTPGYDAVVNRGTEHIRQVDAESVRAELARLVDYFEATAGQPADRTRPE